MKTLGYMSYKAALRYYDFFSAQGIECEIKDYMPFFHFLLGASLGNNKKVYVLVKDEDFTRARALFEEEERKYVRSVGELMPAANRAMLIVGLVILTGAVVLYWLIQPVK